MDYVMLKLLFSCLKELNFETLKMNNHLTEKVKETLQTFFQNQSEKNA